MNVLFMLVLIAILGGILFWCMISDTPALFNLAIIGFMLWLGYLAYQDIADLVALWAGITNWHDSTTAYVAASWDDFLDGMTTWGWVAFGLGATFGFLIFGVVGLLFGLYLANSDVKELKRQLEKARKETAREREEARQAKKAAAKDREAAEEAERLRYGAESRAQGLQGQLDKAVLVSDKRGRENKDLRADKKKLQAEVAELRARLPAGEQKAIVTPLVRERRGSTKRGTRTGP